MELTETQQKMFDAAAATIRAHLTVYGYHVSKNTARTEIIISDPQHNQLILKAVK